MCWVQTTPEMTQGSLPADQLCYRDKGVYLSSPMSFASWNKENETLKNSGAGMDLSHILDEPLRDEVKEPEKPINKEEKCILSFADLFQQVSILQALPNKSIISEKKALWVKSFLMQIFLRNVTNGSHNFNAILNFVSITSNI